MAETKKSNIKHERKFKKEFYRVVLKFFRDGTDFRAQS